MGVYFFLHSNKEAESKIRQKFNCIISKINKEWLRKLKRMGEELDNLIDN
jgi:lipopolysaccharide biosynthesis glycosyltransferase